MSSNVQTQINDLNAAVQALESSLTQITGNTMSNYNQLSRIVAQQANIYNSVYYGIGNIVTGNLSVNENVLISGNLVINNGNVGLGTATPLALLDVNGNARINGNLNIDNGTLWVDNVNNRIGLLNTNPLQTLDVKGSANISVNTFIRNNLAIGATSASANLDIQGNARITGNLNVDSGTMWVDATNSRVGIFNTNPQYTLDVKGLANVTSNIFCDGISTDSTQTPLKILSGNITTNASGYYNFAWTQFTNTPYLVMTAIDNQVNMRIPFIRTISNNSANIRVVDTANGGVSVIVNYIVMGY